MHLSDTQSRREFLQVGWRCRFGSGLRLGSWQAGACRRGDAARGKKKLPFPLGLASYTLRKFDLDQTLAMTQRVGLTHICLKSFHLPLDATPEQIAAAVAKVKAAGIDLYGGGVITMKTDKDVDPGFRLCQGGRDADDRRPRRCRTCCRW